MLADPLQLCAAVGADDVEVDFEDVSCSGPACDAVSRELGCECHVVCRELSPVYSVSGGLEMTTHVRPAEVGPAQIAAICNLRYKCSGIQPVDIWSLNLFCPSPSRFRTIAALAEGDVAIRDPAYTPSTACRPPDRALPRPQPLATKAEAHTPTPTPGHVALAESVLDCFDFSRRYGRAAAPRVETPRDLVRSAAEESRRVEWTEIVTKGAPHDAGGRHTGSCVRQGRD